jgi:nucleotide-binding universal stress UspA family protein
MTDPTKLSIDRILLAIDASLQEEDVLETAVEAAVLLNAHLLALFVEDTNLLKLAELPFAKELDRSSGTMRSLDPGGIRRALQADAQRFRKRLNSASEKRKIGVSMRVVRGQCVTTAMEMAGSGDIVVLSNVAGVTYRASTRVRARTGGRTRPAQKSVCAVYDGTPGSRRALAVATGLAGKNNSGLLVLVDKGLEGDAEELLQKLNSDEPSVHCELLPLTGPGSVVNPDRGRACSIVVMPRNLEGKNHVANRFKCPRLLV